VTQPCLTLQQPVTHALTPSRRCKPSCSRVLRPGRKLRRVRVERTRLVRLAQWAISLCALLLTSCGTPPPVTPQGTTPTPTPPPPPTQPPTGTWLGDGTYTVGVDIRAGRWHTDGPRTVRGDDTVDDVVGASKCVWRLGWLDIRFGVPKMIPIASNDDSGPADVDVGPDGVQFQTNGCKVWYQRETPGSP
jgi:hypothetical protein